MLLTGDLKTNGWIDFIDMSSNKLLLYKLFNNKCVDIDKFSVFGHEEGIVSKTVDVSLLYEGVPPGSSKAWQYIHAVGFKLKLCFMKVKFLKISCLSCDECNRPAISSLYYSKNSKQIITTGSIEVHSKTCYIKSLNSISMFANKE